jgi:predicted GH43/DUF377 family glycosyl hydrolase
MKAVKKNILLKSDSRRVLLRPLEILSKDRITNIISLVLSLPEAEVKQEIEMIKSEFGYRHIRLLQLFEKRFELSLSSLVGNEQISIERKQLLGAYFSHEYSIEAAALFNPSMIWHPDQSGLPEKSKRFILSLRSTGEGHISSITFRTGKIDAENNIELETPSRFTLLPQSFSIKIFEKKSLIKKLVDQNIFNKYSELIINSLPKTFSLLELRKAVEEVVDNTFDKRYEMKKAGRKILRLAMSDYEFSFSVEDELSERVIFPYSPSEIKGMEDSRFVEFQEENGSIKYFATYTANDGIITTPQILETKDFLHFKINTLHGSEVLNKGMALFPQKLNGKYAMISRQDNENLYIMYSDDLYLWNKKTLLMTPAYPWEFVQIGNCGSPIETEAGWLLLTHGVGQMRKYSIGAVLLDLNDPQKVIGRLKEPLLSPDEDEREGYVPNVVYSCGGQIHNGELIIPYARSDHSSSFATVNVNELIAEILKNRA